MLNSSRKIRPVLGELYYRYRRFLSWYFGGKKFARNRDRSCLPCVAFGHQTPLLRRLQSVDMWLQHNKVVNLGIAAKMLDGIVVQPGETFSYWYLIGRPTRRKGYLKGMVLVNGQVKAGVGGGLCQLSNLIYWLTLHTPLTVVERYRHNFDVFPDVERTVPFGSGATCYYNYVDLQIYNGTGRPYQLKVWLTESELAGEWRTVQKQVYRYEIYQKDHRIAHEYLVGYVRHNTIRRRVYHGNELIGDEYIAENHALMMYNPYLDEPGKK